MNKDIQTLVNYRLDRAHEALEEADILLKNNHTNTFVNRLYYACFYAVSALLLTKNLSSSKHSGVRSLFHQNFVKYGSVETEFGQIFDKLFDNRQKGDYADLIRFDLNEVRDWLNEAQKFVDALEEVINKELKN